MKITSITPQKKRENRYNVFIDNAFAFGIDGVELLYYKLKEGEELSEERYEMIMEQLVFIKARETALKFIEFKQRTKKEVVSKLRGEYSDEIIARVTDLLEKYRIIDDENYTRLYIRDCLNLKGWGRQRILNELAARGIDREKAAPLLDGTEDTMREKAERLMEKRIKSRPIDMKEYKKQLDFLMRRGFEYETAKAVLEPYRNEEI